MADSALAPGVKAGDTIRCTVTKVPQRTDVVQTIQRLMRRDPENGRALRKSQHLRLVNLVVRTRGGRPWTERHRVGKVVRVALGEKWTMTAIPQIASDLRSVADFIEIEKA
ncbi:MAG: hypothetical protein KAS72_13200 [Phycisphaerales bacterium]|nr:hypothetical protein [Phycisphaerales bacterium]